MCVFLFFLFIFFFFYCFRLIASTHFLNFFFNIFLTGIEFLNLRNDITTNNYEITGLKGGGKYKFRVRPEINGLW